MANEQDMDIRKLGGSDNPKPETIHKTELTTGTELVKMEILKLKDKCEIPVEVWKPLFGGKDLEDLWDKLLQDTGDFLILKGSSVVKMWNGGFAVDKDSGLASAATRSDIDVVVTNNNIVERLKTLEVTNKQLSYNVVAGAVKVDITPENNLREFFSTELRSLNQRIIESAEGADLDAEQAYNTLISNIKTLERLEFGPPEITMAESGFFKHECMGVKLQRSDTGELKAYFLDPYRALEDRLLFPSIYEQVHEQEKRNIYLGVTLVGTNFTNPYYKFMEAATVVPDIRVENPNFSYFINTIPTRLMVADAELDITLYGHPYGAYNVPLPEYGDYLLIYNMAQKYSEGNNLFAIPDEQEKARVEKLIETKFQRDFARAAFFDPNIAITYMFANMPLGKFVSPEVARRFDEYHDRFCPDNTRMFLLNAQGVSLENIPPEYDTEATRTLFRVQMLTEKHYKMADLLMRSPDDKEMVFWHNTNPPQSISEVLGLLFVASGMDFETNKEAIQNCIENWKPKGKLNLTWKRTKDVEFDMEPNEKDIEVSMKMFQKYLDMEPNNTK